MSTPCKKTGGECYGLSELNLLLAISTLLNERKRDIKTGLKEAIALLANYLQAERVILTILNRANAHISIEVAYGLSDIERKKIFYKPGEGIIGKVIESGNPVVIPKIAESTNYLNKTEIPLSLDGKDISFICVPINDAGEIVGTLSMHKIYNPHVGFSEHARVLSIIGSMVTQSVRMRQEYREEIQMLKDENQKLHGELIKRIRPNNLIGNSANMQAVFELIDRVATTNATVLIRGESGVGKELIADAIHFGSTRKSKPFIKVNCAALPESLLESELFGHEKGAFTGANASRAGRFEAANTGTIFLDEIGDLPLSTQVKLLRIIQEREFERLGSTKPIKLDVRIICATNRNLEELIKKGDFREDFYYRINVFPLFVPPLRERGTDIPGLADHFVHKFNKTHHRAIKRISSSAIDMLMVYHWPGNIRELENCIEWACIMTTDNVVRAHNLPPSLQTAVSSKTKSSGTLESIVGKVEKQIIIETLLSTRGNIIKAAEKLGVTERMMGIRIKKYEIDTRRFKGRNEG
jgi:Nif-specific regulatory protein